LSNFLAFATVTAALRELLDPAAKRAVSAANATIERPDLLKTDEPRVNLFLYQVTPNADWRNADLPARRGDGTLAQRPQAAFNLHYVLSFYGKEGDFEPQRILGSVVSLLHAQPVLSRGMIRDASAGLLAASDLASQVDLVRFTPILFNLEELSKLWSVFFQVPYKLSVAYQASVVLVEPEISTQPALPVTARNLYVRTLKSPEVDEVAAAAGPGLPITVGDTIVLRGRNLRGEITRVRVGGIEVAPPSADVTDSEVRVPLTAPAFANLRAGVLGAQVVHQLLMGTPATPHRGFESNAAPFVLRPRLKTHTVGDTEVADGSVSAPDGDGFRTVAPVVEPQVAAGQRAVLLLNETSGATPRAFSAVAERRAGDADPLEFRIRDLGPGTYLARVQVDGAESPLLPKVDGGFAGPVVNVP